MAQGPAVCHRCSRVESVIAIHAPAKASGVGIAAGTTVGEILDRHAGGGNGRTLVTGAETLAKGYGGNENESARVQL